MSRVSNVLSCVAGVGALFVASNACTNDYDPYAFGPATVHAGASAQGSGGDGNGGATGGATGGAPNSSAEGGGANGPSSGGANGPSSGGAPNTPPNPDESCGDDEAYCGDRCVVVDTVERCGGCDNDCSTQGAGNGFDCIGLRCGCSDVEQCGADATRCAVLTGACVCDGVTCRRGEVCEGQQNNVHCSCNGEDACAEGETCCASPTGCFDVKSDNDNCGGCGRQCAAGESCLNGLCRAP